MPNDFDYMTEREVHETFNKVGNTLLELHNDLIKKEYTDVAETLSDIRGALDAAHHDYTEVINDPA